MPKEVNGRRGSLPLGTPKKARAPQTHQSRRMGRHVVIHFFLLKANGRSKYTAVRISDVDEKHLACRKQDIGPEPYLSPISAAFMDEGEGVGRITPEEIEFVKKYWCRKGTTYLKNMITLLELSKCKTKLE